MAILKSRLHNIIAEKSLEAIQNLRLDQNMLQSRNEHGESLLHIVTLRNDVAIVRHMLDLSLDINLTDNDGWTALQTAAENDCDKVIPVLLVAGADVDERDKYGKTPLMVAVNRKAVSSAEALVAGGANPTLADNSGTTSIELAKKLRLHTLLPLLKGEIH